LECWPDRDDGGSVTDPLFLLDDLGRPVLGTRVALGGPEGRHASVVRRIGIGEMIMIADGLGSGVRGPVVAVDKSGLVVEVTEQLQTPVRARRFVAVQALAKGDRSELAIEMLTELGIDEIVPWSAARSIVRWTGDRAEKSLSRWRSTVREAAKQSRRLTVPTVTEARTTKQLATRITEAAIALVLHEDATESLVDVELPTAGTVMIIIGPEGGITAEELDALLAAGAHAVSISDGVLRTSTAGVVALAGLLLR
jgi:16S rRNA (uracil1498-N3)-methyltransferase